jgi:hypothetical protein
MHANETPFGGTTSTAAGPTLAGKGGAPIWQPGPDAVSDASITRFAELVTATSGHRFDGYQDLWSWSVEHLEEFWSAIWEFFGIEADGDPTTVLLVEQERIDWHWVEQRLPPVNRLEGSDLHGRR